VAKQQLESALLPLREYLITSTSVYRKYELNKNLHVVALSDSILQQAGVKKSRMKGFRQFAYNWARKYSTNYLNDEYTIGQKFVVFDNYAQAGSFFTRAKTEGFLKGDGAIDRGHVVAAVREFGQESLDRSVSELELLGANQTAINSLKRIIQSRLNKVKPAKVGYNFSRRIEVGGIDADLDLVVIIPEPSGANRSKKEEKQLKNEVDKALNKWLKTNADKVFDMPGSKSIKEAYSDVLDDLIIHNKKSTYNKTTKGKKSLKGKKGRAPKVTGVPFPKPRDSKGRFTSPIALMNLINSRLHNVLRKNMHSPALNYQTGRFARSVKITNISQTRQAQMTAFYTYMKSPYQTFERGYAQGSPQRDPRTLISKSIREAAAQIMGQKFDIRTRRQ